MEKRWGLAGLGVKREAESPTDMAIVILQEKAEKLRPGR